MLGLNHGNGEKKMKECARKRISKAKALRSQDAESPWSEVNKIKQSKRKAVQTTERPLEWYNPRMGKSWNES